MALKPAIQVARTLEKLTSDNPAIRGDAWNEMHEHGAEFRENLDADQLFYLRNLAGAESNTGLFVPAVKALFALAMATPGRTGPPEGTAVPGVPLDQVVAGASGLLAHWLWDPFHGSSAVLGVTATNYRRRDEAAQLWIGRRLSFADYPRTRFPRVALDNPDVSQVLFSEGYQAFCIVGRLSLFGETALQRFGNDGLRFGFDVPCRPKDLPPGELDRKYHCVFERVGDGTRKYHRTVEKDGFRTDFAVVQRYHVELSTQHVIVVIIAGASSLGTMAAAQWAAYDLFQPTDAVDKKCIDLPMRATPHSRMEALLSVRARVTTTAWEHPEIQLRKLSMDSACWSLKDQEWHEAPIQRITVIREGGQPVRVLFDGHLSRLEPGKQMFRLMVAIVDKAQSSRDGEIDVSALAADEAIWGGSVVDEVYVRAQLRLLRTRYLREALCMRGGLKLHAETRQVDSP